MENIDNKYKKKNPFSVPDGYFENLTERIAENVKETEIPQKTKVIQMIKPYVGLVAIFLLALFVVQVIFPLVIDDSRMIAKDANAVKSQSVIEDEDADELNSTFQPTSEEIIEYLATEGNDFELLYAGAYN